MKICIITGSAGLIGAESVRFFSAQGFQVVGIDNDMRKQFFGADASTEWSRRDLEARVPRYTHREFDIRDQAAIEALFAEYGSDIALIVHTAAQPSHDWAAKDPHTDFGVNANGTLILLEATRKFAPRACFVFTSTNKVYGDNPNHLPLVELESRWEIDPSHPYHVHGIDERLSVDQTRHSLFGVSKLAADAMVQEYGRYFDMNTVCFRGGCLTGPGHSGTMMHGFLSYLVKCAITGARYTVFGYRGKQVRDNIHSFDLVNMFWEYYQAPRPGAVYNAGGGRFSHCSMKEAVAECERRTGRPMDLVYTDDNRIGDHIWYISDTRKFAADYPGWKQTYDLPRIMDEIFESTSARVRVPPPRLQRPPPMDFESLLITGGAGFVGSNLAILFREAHPDRDVIAFDNLKRRGSELNLPRLAAAGVRFVHGDIRSTDDLDDLPPFDLMIDCSAEPSVQAGLSGSPRGLLETNLVGTINCLEAARVRGAAFLFLSTNRIFPIGPLNALPFAETETRFRWDDRPDVRGFSAHGIAEDFPVDGARSFYGASKLAGEQLIQEYVYSYGMRALIDRCGVLAGPWQMGKVDQGVITLWVARHVFGRPLRYTGFGGTGKQVRDLLHVHDLFDLIRLQMAAPEKWDGRIYNVGGGNEVSVSLRELTELCVQETGRTVPIEPVADTSGVDLRIYATDARKVRSEFGWSPTRDPARIVRDIRAWIEANRASLQGLLS